MTRRKILKQIARNVQKLREQQGLTPTELARKIDDYTATIVRIEEEKHMPRTDLLYDLAAALGVTPNDLLGIETPASVS